jgi:hypothetical protein
VFKASAHRGEVSRVPIPLLSVTGPAERLQVVSLIRPAVVAGNDVIYFDAFFLRRYAACLASPTGCRKNIKPYGSGNVTRILISLDSSESPERCRLRGA